MTLNEYVPHGVFATEYPIPFLIYAFCIGSLLGVMLDTATAFEKMFGKNAIILFFTDLISMVSAYLLLFAGALFFNNGIMRWYHVFFFLCGNRMYSVTVSCLVRLVIDKLYNIVLRVLRLAALVLMLPVRCTTSFIISIYRRIVRLVLSANNTITYNRQKRIFEQSASKGFDLYKCEPDSEKIKKRKKEWKIKESEKLRQ